MQNIQKRWKAIAAFLSVGLTNLYAFYQAHQNLTLKQFVTSVIAAVLGGAIVHQVTNKGE